MSFSFNISQQIHDLSPSHIIVGYSGGVDSSVILDICSKLNIPTIAIHINHNVNTNADNWQKHCQTICESKGIQFLAHKLDKCPKGESFEAWASKQRMKYFQETLESLPSPILLLGHHQDDQAETFLIQAVRGAGIAGLAAMPKLKEYDNYKIFRPLLDTPRNAIEKFAQDNNIFWVHDDSNDKTIYRRNFIRHEIITPLKKINPSISKTLSRSASLCAKSNNILAKLLTKELENIQVDKKLNIKKLKALDKDIQESLVHLWFKKQTTISLKAKQIDNIINAINNATTGWSIDIGSFKIVLEYGLVTYQKIDTSEISKLSNDDIFLWLSENSSQKFDKSKIIIRDRLSTDRCRYIGRNKDNKLKLLFQELKIPANKRFQARIIESNNKIIAVYPFFICP